MDNMQLEALDKLIEAIGCANVRGLFDILPCYVHPDVINTFIDAVNEMHKTENGLTTA